MNALISSPAGKTPEIPARKFQTDDDVALHGVSVIGCTVVNFRAQVTTNHRRYTILLLSAISSFYSTVHK